MIIILYDHYIRIAEAISSHFLYQVLDHRLSHQCQSLVLGFFLLGHRPISVYHSRSHQERVANAWFRRREIPTFWTGLLWFQLFAAVIGFCVPKCKFTKRPAVVLFNARPSETIGKNAQRDQSYKYSSRSLLNCSPTFIVSRCGRGVWMI